jgi:leucyl aminopeptidase
METKLLYQPLDRVEADAVAVALFEGEAAPAELKFAAAWLEELRASGEFVGKSGELAVLHQPQGIRAKRLVVAGGGKRAKFDAPALRKTAGVVAGRRKRGGGGGGRAARKLRAGSPQAVE